MVDKLIDQRSEQLIEEFYAHLSEYRKKEPGADRHIVFEGWVIQKISSLQLMVFDKCGDCIIKNSEKFGKIVKNPEI